MAEIIKLKKKTKWGGQYTFRCRYKNLEGKTKYYTSGAFRTKEECENAERIFQLNKNKPQIMAKEMTFKELYELYYEHQKKRVKETTLLTYKDRERYLQMFDDINVHKFDISLYDKWHTEMCNNKNINDGMRNYVLKYLKAIMNFGTKHYGIDFTNIYNKLEKFRDPNAEEKEMDFYTFDEFQKFISVEDELLWKSFFTLLFFQGLRKGEARALTWKDIDFENKEMRIKQTIVDNLNGTKFVSWQVKTLNSKRILPMTSTVFELLKELKQEMMKYKNFEETWYVFGNFEPLSDNKIFSRNKTNAEKAGIRKIRIHDFRHSCATLLVSNGADIKMVQLFLGHASVRTTLDTYSHLYKGKLNSITALMDNVTYKN